jgi:hypothetical protein
MEWGPSYHQSAFADAFIPPAMLDVHPHDA